MGDKLTEIERALASFRMDEARELAQKELDENPSATAYYLASQAALNHGQRVDYLEKALELDPTYQVAQDELAEMSPEEVKSKRADEPTGNEIQAGRHNQALSRHHNRRHYCRHRHLRHHGR